MQAQSVDVVSMREAGDAKRGFEVEWDEMRVPVLKKIEVESQKDVEVAFGKVGDDEDVRKCKIVSQPNL